MTIILAKFLGLYFLTIGLALIISSDRLKKLYHQMINDENFIFMGGLLAVLIGSAVISLHNHWILSWPLIITLFGWWSLIRGFIVLSYPDSIKFVSIENREKLFYQVLSLIYIILGLFLIYKGWWS